MKATQAQAVMLYNAMAEAERHVIDYLGLPRNLHTGAESAVTYERIQAAHFLYEMADALNKDAEA